MSPAARSTPSLAGKPTSTYGKFMRAILAGDTEYAEFILDFLGFEDAVAMLERLIRRPRLVHSR